MKDKSSIVGLQLSIDTSTEKGSKAIKLLNISPRKKSELLIIALNELAESYGIEDFTKEEMDNFIVNFSSIKNYLNNMKTINVSMVGQTTVSTPSVAPMKEQTPTPQAFIPPADIPNPFAAKESSSLDLNESDIKISESRKQDVKNMLNAFNIS